MPLIIDALKQYLHDSQKAAIEAVKGWGGFEGEDGDFHVKPMNDYREHVSSKDCWCHPTPDEAHPNIYGHHSIDLREEYEQGRKLS